MIRRLIVAIMIVTALLVGFGCTGDDGPEGPAGSDGQNATPRAIRILILGSQGAVGLKAIALGLFGDGAVNPNTTIQVFDGAAVAPELSDLTTYNVVLAYASGSWSDADSTGDALADYVDVGGKVVIAQGAMSSGGPFAIMGRFMTVGYSPFSADVDAGDATDRIFDQATIAEPPHPVFLGVNSVTFSAPAGAQFSDPPLLGMATLIAAFTNGHNAIAINAGGTAMGLNVFPFADNAGVMRLLANAMHHLTGAF